MVLDGDCDRQVMGAKFLRRIANHFANEMAVVSPNGQMLSGANDLAEGLEKWRTLPPAERRRFEDLGTYDTALDREPPAGALVLQVYARGLERDTDGQMQIYRNPKANLSQEAGRDHFWLTEAEWKSLLPSEFRKGARKPVPDSIVDRICRRSLIDLVRIGGNGGPRRAEHVLFQKLWLTVEELKPDLVRLRIDGSAGFVTRGPEYGVPDKSERRDTFQALGFLNYDLATKTFTRFDLVALSDTGHYDEIGQKIRPLGIAFEQAASAAPTDREQRGSLEDIEKKHSTKASGDDLRELARHLATRRGKKPIGPAPSAPGFPFDASTARNYQRAYADWLALPPAWTNDLGMTFILIPPGAFQMGSPEEEPGHNSGGYDETLHSVTLTRPFYLSQHEVTVAQFRAFVEARKYGTDIEKNGGGHAHDETAEWKHRTGTNWRQPGFAGAFTLEDNHPVVHVSHTDSRQFCRWLQERSGVEGLTFDLPTEAQWEWACRAGAATRYWWGPGEDTTGKVANVGDRSLKHVHPKWPRSIMPTDDKQAFLAPVGSYQPNAFGLHDMLGNVWEFCFTHYAPYPREAVIDPKGGDPKRGYAVRGDGWSNIASDVRCASRNADPPHFGHSNLGFRIAVQVSTR